ncbi:hypothetical protein BKA61DRAFT_132500 [Leptodontidium sp. MPI-SDFR-AT-0119]|nr:hypothetical protein BKA61DRAFT_132500 [Leptodontidium sp. MPI-SDFR-AT-0119]
MPYRLVYLIVYRSRMYPAHWAMWIPRNDADTQAIGMVGKYINVQGDSREGFVHEITRSHDMAQSNRNKEVILLGWTDEVNVVDNSGETETYFDTEAIDRLEEIALQILAPGPSLRSASSSSSGSRTRVALQNCQTWMTEVVGNLVENNLLEEGANTVIANAPKN